MENKNLFKDYKKEIESVRMTRMERSKIRAKLLLEMRKQKGKVKRYGLFVNWHAKVAWPSIAFASLAIFVGVMANAAEKALPGDALYSIKVNGTEKVWMASALSKEASANVASALAERRLAEAEKLAYEGKLDEQTKEMLSVKFYEHMGQANKAIESIGQSEDHLIALEVNSHLEALLSAHIRVLEGVVASSEDSVANSLLSGVQQIVSNTALRREKAEEKVASSYGLGIEELAQSKYRQSQRKIEQLHRALENGVEGLKRSEAKIAQDQLARALDSILAGTQKLESGDYGTALTLFEQALRFTKEAEVFTFAQDNSL